MRLKSMVKHESHSRCRSASPPARSVTSSTVVQKHVGHTSVQLPQVRQRSATSSQRGCSRLRCSSSASPAVSSERPICDAARSTARAAASWSRGSAGRAGSSSATCAPRSLPTSTRKRWPSLVEQLGQRQVVARPDLRPGLHRDAEAGAAGLAAVDRDDERVAAARLVVVVGVCTADEDAVLDLDRMQLAAPDSDERERRRRRVRPARR